jgi:endogenous inhibitor of DNA gyrase (YacG/DUF329 family)
VSASTKCRTCHRVAKREGNKFFPFCCERCQMADLGRWLREEYRVPDETTPVTGPGPDEES